MTGDRMPPQDDPRLEAYLGGLAGAPVPADLAASVSTRVRERPGRRPSVRLPVFAAAAGLLLVISIAMATGWQPPFDVLPGPQPSPSADAATTPPPSASPVVPPAPDDWAFARVAVAGAELRTEPGGGHLIRTLGDEDTWTSVLVLGHTVVDGRGWSKVEWEDRHGVVAVAWLEETVPSRGPTGYEVPVLQRTTWLPCHGADSVTPDQVAGLTHAERLACFGSGSFSFGPVWVVDDPRSSDEGSPAWLAGPAAQAITMDPGAGPGGLVAPLRFRPEHGLQVPAGERIRLTGHFDDGAALGCERTEARGGAPVGDTADQVLWCRQQLVITGWTLDREPRVPVETPISGGVLEGTLQSLPMAPLAGRVGQSAVMAGSRLVVWGGDVHGDAWPAPDGATIDVFGDREWVPMSRSPLGPRRDALVAWTGSEVLFWGGRGPDGTTPADGAAWDPASNGWRSLPAAPLRADGRPAAAWAGERWLVMSGTSLASYDPAADAWTAEPPLPRRAGDDTPRLAWTGQELFVIAHEQAGYATWTLRPGGDWEQHEAPPACWTPVGQPVAGDGAVMLLGLRRPADCESEPAVPSLAVWSPRTGAWRLVDTPWSPDLRGPIAWTGSRLVLAGADGALAWSPATGSWAELPGYGEDRLRDGPSLLAALDRVIVWGGGFFGRGDPQPDGGEYILGTSD